MDRGRSNRVEDLLAEPLVTSLRDVYLDVEGVLRMRRAGCKPWPASPSSPLSSSSEKASSHESLVRLMERCLEGGSEVVDVPPVGVDGVVSPQQVFVFSELQRINRFVKQGVEREWSRLIHVSQELWSAVDECAMLEGGASERQAVEQHAARLRSILGCARNNVQDIDVFVRHNVVLGEYVARRLDSNPAREVISGHPMSPSSADLRRDQDADTTSTEHNLYVVGIERVLMQGVRISSVMMALSDLYEGVRVLEAHGRQAKQVLEGVLKAAWKPPSKFSRVVKKFWILPKDVMRFKLFVMQHLPILVYGERQKVLDAVRHGGGYRGAQAYPMERFACGDSGEIASVYLDSVPSLQHYHDRLHRSDKAMVTRIRWYGTRDTADGEKSIFVERKTHRNAYTGLASAKERGCIMQRDVNDFLGGRFAVAEGRKDGELLSSVMKQICEENQEILMRTTYSRTAFQNATENTVRISLDTNLCMTRERGYQTSSSWCRDFQSHPLHKDDVAQFPYGVVEIKLQASPPQWVRDLVNSGMLLVVPKFSKFLHGTAMLYQDVTENVPYWFLPDPVDEGRMTPATWDEMADKECVFARDAADWLFPQGFELPKSQERHLTMPIFRPKRKTGAQQPARQPTTNATDMQDASAREAMHELEDESGNRTWCDVETVEMEDTVDGVECASGAGGEVAAAMPLNVVGNRPQVAISPVVPTTRKPSWPVYQSVGENILEGGNNTEHGGSSFGFDCGTSNSSASEHTGSESCVTVLPLDTQDKQHFKDSIIPLSEQLNPIQPSPYSMSGSFGVMQYSMSMATDDGEGGGNADGDHHRTVTRKRSTSIVRTRVEPKTFFANERTFLQWINVSVLVMFLALSLLSGSVIPGMGSNLGSACEANDERCLAGKMSGAIIAPVALTFMGYALYMYKKRTIQILRRETVRYDDQRGPVVLVRFQPLLFLHENAYPPPIRYLSECQPISRSTTHPCRSSIPSQVVILLLAMTISYILTMIVVL